MRHEHRTLPVLIASGVLLGAGFALASPAGHRVPERRPSPGITRATSTSPSVTTSPTSAPSTSSGASLDPPSACAHGASSPGWAAAQPPLAHAIHVQASSCHGGRGAGLQTAIQHLRQSTERHSGNTHGHAGGAHPTGHHASAGQDKGPGNHTTQTGSSGGDPAAGDGSTGSDPTTRGGVDTVHGQGKDGQHGNDVHGTGTSSGAGDGSSGSTGSDPAVRGSWAITAMA